MNRLNLDFSLQTIEERTSFINDYIIKKEFQLKPLTDTELETIGNYILWGKNKDGKNAKQLKEIQLDSKWDTSPIESLDELKENPTFQESSLRPINAPRVMIRKETFSRAQARQFASPDVLAHLESIWHDIDTIDLTINFYDLAHNKRTKPPRESLLKIFTPEETEKIKLKAESLSQFHYLKLRHLLVEKRREQFSYKDTYTNLITRNSPEIYIPPSDLPDFDADLPVFPFGLNNQSDLYMKIFNPDRFPIPSDFTPEELNRISKQLWAKQEKHRHFFDFRDIEHVYQFLLLFEEIKFDPKELPIDSTLNQLFVTFNFYRARAQLSPLQQDVLDLKIKHYKNQDIADIINPKYQKTYNANYISTIFRQKVILSINNAAVQHLEILHNIFFPENFKQCKDCKEILLLNSENFMRKSKSKDGYSPRCKKCDKEQRLRRTNK